MAYNPIIHKGTYGATDINDQADRLAAELNRPYAPDLVIKDATNDQIDRFVEVHRWYLRVGWNPASNVMTMDHRGSGTPQEYLSDDELRDKFMLAIKHKASTTLRFSGAMKHQRARYAKVV